MLKQDKIKTPQKPIFFKKQIKVKFLPEEDALLRELVQKYGARKWKDIARHLPNRNARQCRERWHNYLSGSVILSPWTEEEDQILKSKFEEIGPKWSIIAQEFPNRTDVHVKNRMQILKRRMNQYEINQELQKGKDINQSEAVLEKSFLQVVKPIPLPQNLMDQSNEYMFESEIDKFDQ